MKEFNLNGRDFIQLCDLLKVAGIMSSGGQAKFAIAEGKVTVNGNIEVRKKCKIHSGSIVVCAGHTIKIIA